MNYRAVGNRCAVDIDDLGLPLSRKRVMKILAGQNFIEITIDLVVLARQCIGVSKYRRGAAPELAPGIVDCSSFVRWLYGHKGIWLPRRSIQQMAVGRATRLASADAGDLIFTTGPINYYVRDPDSGVGHVGFVTNAKTVIHAAGEHRGVIETPLEQFIGGRNKLRGIRRYLPKTKSILTLQTPPGKTVETSDDIKWIVLQCLPDNTS